MHRIEASRLADEKAHASERAPGKDHAVLGAMGQDELLSLAEEFHVMLPRDGSPAKRGKADRPRLAREAGAVTRDLRLKLDAPAAGGGVADGACGFIR